MTGLNRSARIALAALTGFVVGVLLCVWLMFPIDIMANTEAALGMRIICAILVGVCAGLGAVSQADV